MAVPVAPAAGEPIAEAWGDVVHDAVVAQDIQSGKVTVQMTNQASNKVLVTFPRPFAAIPNVVATVNLGTGVWVGVVMSASATQAEIGAFHRAATTSTAAVPVCWVAIGPRA
jgi:hypothetical protein